MAWRVNLTSSQMTQLGMDWGLCAGSLLIVLPTVLTVSGSTTAEQEAGAEPEQDSKLEDQ